MTHGLLSIPEKAYFHDVLYSNYIQKKKKTFGKDFKVLRGILKMTRQIRNY